MTVSQFLANSGFQVGDRFEIVSLNSPLLVLDKKYLGERGTIVAAAPSEYEERCVFHIRLDKQPDVLYEAGPEIMRKIESTEVLSSEVI